MEIKLRPLVYKFLRTLYKNYRICIVDKYLNPRKKLTRTARRITTERGTISQQIFHKLSQKICVVVINNIIMWMSFGFSLARLLAFHQLVHWFTCNSHFVILYKGYLCNHIENTHNNIYFFISCLALSTISLHILFYNTLSA